MRLDGYILEDGKRLYVGPFQKKTLRQKELQRMHQENQHKESQSVSLYISNLDVTIDERLLELIFSKYGNVTGTNVS